MPVKTKPIVLWMSGIALSALMPTLTFAQATDNAAVKAPSSAESDSLQDIVVTAQRRSESAQSVPISVAAFSAEALANSRALSSDDLTGLVAGLTLQSNGARTPIYLRGVGNNNAAASPSVLTFVDGVYMPFNYGSQAFNDVSSIEIAKGPQGTLFGRNATGGVIQITTKDPTSSPTSDLEIGYGNYDTVTARAYVASGLGPRLRVGVAAFYENQRDGWGTNLATGGDIFKSKKYGARSKFVFDVSDVTAVRLTADYSYGRGNNGSTISPAAGSDFLFDYVRGTTYRFPGKYDVNANFSPYFTTKEGGASLTVDSSFGDVKFLSISSWRKNRSYLQVDYDGTEIPFFDLSRIDKSTAYTQELQLSSKSGGRFVWVAGLFYFRQTPEMVPFRFAGIGASAVFGAPAGVPFELNAFDKSNAYAAYGQASLELLTDTTLTLGARYTIEKHRQKGFNQAGAIIPSSVGSQSATFKKPTFRASLDHKFSPDLMVFASFNRGFNAGYFNPVSVPGFTAAANPVVLPEVIDAYEVGIKSQLFDRKLRINLSAFQYDYSNLQQQIFQQGALVTVNAAAARIRGVDLDIQARPVPELELAVSAEYLDPKYRSYDDAPFYFFESNGSLSTGVGDAKGFSTTNAPKFSINASATHSLATTIGTFQSTASVNYRGKTYADAFEKFPIKTRYLINLTERWVSNDDQLSASLWVKNLLNERYDESRNILSPVGAVSNPGAPRTYGVTLGYHFGG